MCLAVYRDIPGVSFQREGKMPESAGASWSVLIRKLNLCEKSVCKKRLFDVNLISRFRGISFLMVGWQEEVKDEWENSPGCFDDMAFCTGMG